MANINIDSRWTCRAARIIWWWSLSSSSWYDTRGSIFFFLYVWAWHLAPACVPIAPIEKKKNATYDVYIYMILYRRIPTAVLMLPVANNGHLSICLERTVKVLLFILGIDERRKKVSKRSVGTEMSCGMILYAIHDQMNEPINEPIPLDWEHACCADRAVVKSKTLQSRISYMI